MRILDTVYEDLRYDVVRFFLKPNSWYCMILLEVMREVRQRNWGRTVEPSVGPKTVVMSFPRVIVIGLLALAKVASRFAATEGVDVCEVG